MANPFNLSICPTPSGWLCRWRTAGRGSVRFGVGSDSGVVPAGGMGHVTAGLSGHSLANLQDQVRRRTCFAASLHRRMAGVNLLFYRRPYVLLWAQSQPRYGRKKLAAKSRSLANRSKMRRLLSATPVVHNTRAEKMGPYSPIWGLGIYAMAFITVSVLIGVSPYCLAISQRDNGRFPQIDGLRGYLAICVFVSHAASMKQWQDIGVWVWPTSSFFNTAGTAPVYLFFMITAFLFWGKAIRSRGRVNPYRLLVSRLRRLAPLYLCTIPILLFFVGVASDWRIRTKSQRDISRNRTLVSYGYRWLCQY